MLKNRLFFKTIKRFEYSDEITDFKIFKQLSAVTKQETLDMGVQLEIIDEFKKIDELSEVLNVLRIVIKYAITTSANPQESIALFIRKIYTESSEKQKQVESLLKTKIIEHGKLMYLKHLWLLLMMKQSVLYTLNGQDPFENLNVNFKHEGEMNFAIKYEYPVKVTLLNVIYQIIEFMLTPLEGDDLQSYGRIP
jgi:hypothetical protein